MRKRMLAWLFICSLAAGTFTGCGGSTAGTGSGQGQTEAETEETEMNDTTETTAQRTAYPGGYWEPGEPKYGVSELQSDLEVPIVDGKVLKACAFYPTDLTTGEIVKDETFPVIIEWTCYSGEPATYYTQYGYISAMVWVEGTCGSDGEVRMYDEGEDASYIVDWAEALEGSDGNVAFTGASYPAAMALVAATNDARVKCIVANNNSFENALRQCWLISGVPTVGGIFYTDAIPYIYGNSEASQWWAEKAQSDIVAGTGISYDGEFWENRLPMSFAEKIVANDVPVMLSTGYDDIMDNLIIKSWAAFQNAYAGRPVDSQMEPGQAVSPKWQMIYGKWSHVEALDFGLNLQWFETWVRGVDTGLQDTEKPLHLYEGGSDRWFNASTYPLSTKSDPWYLNGDGSLALAQGETGTVDLQLAYPHEENGLYSFTSEPLAEDYSIAGAISATVYASTTTTNLGIIVTIYDVEGEERTEVARGIVLGSQSAFNEEKTWYDENGVPTYVWANLDKDEYLTPGEIYELHMNMACRQWKFAAGHQIVVELTNKSKIEDCPPEGPMPGNTCRPGRYNKKQVETMEGGTFTIYFDAEHPTAVNLPQVPSDAQNYIDAVGILPNPTDPSYPSYEFPLDWKE